MAHATVLCPWQAGLTPSRRSGCKIQRRRGDRAGEGGGKRERKSRREGGDCFRVWAGWRPSSVRLPNSIRFRCVTVPRQAQFIRDIYQLGLVAVCWLTM